MSLFSQLPAMSVRNAAIGYFYEGFSVIPLTGKQCRVKWAIYQDEIALPQTIDHWNKSGLLQNIGVVCGQVSRNLVVMDLDGLAAVEAFERQFPYLLDTFTVATGSGTGKHYYYRVECLPPTTRIAFQNHQGIELRANGCYVVAPPSIHPDTKMPYRVICDKPIKTLPHMEDVKRWIYAQIARKNSPGMKTEKRTIGFRDMGAYARTALAYECRDVRLTREGNRSNQLNKSAYNIGQLVGDNLLSVGQAEAALLDAAIATGLTESEAVSIIHCGLTNGIKNPRSQQWAKRNK